MFEINIGACHLSEVVGSSPGQSHSSCDREGDSLWQRRFPSGAPVSIGGSGFLLHPLPNSVYWASWRPALNSIFFNFYNVERINVTFWNDGAQPRVIVIKIHGAWYCHLNSSPWEHELVSIQSVDYVYIRAIGKHLVIAITVMVVKIMLGLHK
jgi:hypothetical protein